MIWQLIQIAGIYITTKGMVDAKKSPVLALMNNNIYPQAQDLIPEYGRILVLF